MLVVAWLAFPVVYVPILGRHYVNKCRGELERARSHVDLVLAELEELTALYHQVVVDSGVAPRTVAARGRHHLRT